MVHFPVRGGPAPQSALHGHPLHALHGPPRRGGGAGGGRAAAHVAGAGGGAGAAHAPVPRRARPQSGALLLGRGLHAQLHARLYAQRCLPAHLLRAQQLTNPTATQADFTHSSPALPSPEPGPAMVAQSIS